MAGDFTTLIAVLSLLGFGCVEAKDAVSEYCFQETFNVSCPNNQVIVMRYALYGRMHFGRCMQENHGHKGCFADVLPMFHRLCSGLNHCDVHIPLTGVTVPQCPKELMKYLEADYRCQPVEPSQQCTRHRNSPLKTTNISKFLLPPPEIQNFRGTKKCPWVIQTEPGRQINLTILNFDIETPASGKSGGHFQDSLNCNMVTVIKDHNRTVEKRICKDSKRESLSYMSLSHSVEVYVMATTITAQSHRFIISYTAIGCPDIRDMAHASIKRQGDTLVVKCNYTGETFFLSCTGTHWLGELHNCTAGPNFTPYHNGKSSHFPYGLLIVIGIGVALGVAFGIILLAGILACFKRRKAQQTVLSHHTSDPLLSEVTRETDIDNSSNYYERRFQALATIGRSPRISREPIYNDRCLGQIPTTQQRFCTLPAGSSGTYRQASLPLGSVNTERRAMSESPYCSCVQPGTSPPMSAAGTQLPVTSAHTSFITFKPTEDCSPPSHSAESSPSRVSAASPNIMPARSLDLLKDSGHRSIDLLKDSDHSKIQTVELQDTECTCPTSSKPTPINNNATANHTEQYPCFNYSCNSSNNKSI